MFLTRELAKKIIDLNPHGKVDPKIADRQFEVIVKSFNALQNGRDFIYIADEVGLGKTYIALGIMSLLRHFSVDSSKHKDLIIVPKKNLQDKWQKEIKNFVSNNYLLHDNRVKSVIGTVVGKSGEEELHNKLELISEDSPSYHIFRMSSFSMAVHKEDDTKWDKLFEETKKIDIHEVHTAIKNYEPEKANTFCRYLYAYLLNISMPKINTIIVDEAHNFKHGILGEVSQRNQVMSRMMGIVQNDEIDKKVFELFPDLKLKIKRLSKNMIFLSATPINKSMVDLKNQFDVFVPDHKYKNQETTEELEQDLSKFLIRGVMNIDVNHKPYTRNMYRHEHREGNVEMKFPDPKPITMSDQKSVMLTGLMQYKIMKELNHKNNNSFEIGLLSGFESFSARPKDIVQDSEKDESKIKETKDQNLISELATDYQQHFKETIPHPKMNVLVEELYRALLNGEKALVFVRRIASVKEIEQKISAKYNADLIKVIKKKSSYAEKQKLKILLEEYDRLLDKEKIEHVLELLAKNIASRNIINNEWFIKKVQSRNKPIITEPKSTNEQSNVPKNDAQKKVTIKEIRAEIILEYLIELNEKFPDDDEVKWLEHENNLQEFQNLLLENKNRAKRLSNDLTKVASELISNTWDLIDADNSDEENENEYSEDARQSAKSISSYFFTNFLRGKGKAFKKASYKKDWFELNYLHLLKFCEGIEVNFQKLPSKIQNNSSDSEAKVFRERQSIISQNLFKGNNHFDLIKIPESFTGKTFLTQLITEELKSDFQGFVGSNNLKNDPERFLEKVDLLGNILKGIFRNGSGALPAYLAWASDEKDFSGTLLKILRGDFQRVFNNVLNEVKTILNDFDQIKSINFPDSDKVQSSLLNQLPVQGVSGYHKVNVSKAALQFRMPGWPYILIATDILKEGEDLHTYCTKVYHYGIAWNPSDMEQRTGRIDRIGSKCYHQIKGLQTNDIPFEKKLQVFFPYIKDSFEVIQIVKVFQGMNKFIDTFYDFSKQSANENSAKTNEIVTSIPKQITTKLSSLFDVDKFEDAKNEEGALELSATIGLTRFELEEKVRELGEIITQVHKDKDDEWVKADPENLKISGMIYYENESGVETSEKRHCPFEIKIVNDKVKPGSFEWRIESLIEVSVKELVKKSEESIEQYELGYFSRNEFSVIYQEVPINSDLKQVLKRFEHVVFKADELENDNINSDGKNYLESISPKQN